MRRAFHSLLVNSNFVFETFQNDILSLSEAEEYKYKCNYLLIVEDK